MFNGHLNPPQKKSPTPNWYEGFRKGFGGDLLSHPVAQAVPSAQRSLTAVFGMGTGVASSLLPPKIEVSVLPTHQTFPKDQTSVSLQSVVPFRSTTKSKKLGKRFKVKGERF